MIQFQRFFFHMMVDSIGHYCLVQNHQIGLVQNHQQGIGQENLDLVNLTHQLDLGYLGNLGLEELGVAAFHQNHQIHQIHQIQQLSQWLWLFLVQSQMLQLQMVDYIKIQDRTVSKLIISNLPRCRRSVPESRIILFPDICHLFWSQATGSTATKNHGELGNQDDGRKYDWFCHDLKAYYA